ncbi:MAG: hypothetical protein AABM67_03640 [Acidobacteriota bacterium]
MVESFLIFFAIIAGIVVVVAGLIGAVLFRAFIFAGILFLISAGFIGGGLALLVGVGGVPGAFGLFLMIPGALFGGLGVLITKSGIEEWRR